jgi:hypothetical protein
MTLKSDIQNKRSKTRIKFERDLMRTAVCFISFVSVFLILNIDCRAQSVSSTELIENAKKYDGKSVLYQGEAIGELMKRGEFAWININDGENAIGIWAPLGLIADISLLGSYKQKGDLVEVSGIFNRSCPEHGGDLDIHAREIRKVSKGRQIPERINACKSKFALILVFILGLVWISSLLGKR